MAKKYFYITLLMFGLISAGAMAQENKPQQNAIEGLTFYPNPVNTGKIYITSKSAAEKEIAIFDVLGKKVLQAVISSSSKELNISSLSPGIYIIQIREGEATATRKLIIE